jgi:hypothetical protein
LSFETNEDRCDRPALDTAVAELDPSRVVRLEAQQVGQLVGSVVYVAPVSTSSGTVRLRPRSRRLLMMASTRNVPMAAALRLTL